MTFVSLTTFHLLSINCTGYQSIDASLTNCAQRCLPFIPTSRCCTYCSKISQSLGALQCMVFGLLTAQCTESRDVMQENPTNCGPTKAADVLDKVFSRQTLMRIPISAFDTIMTSQRLSFQSVMIRYLFASRKSSPNKYNLKQYSRRPTP